MLRAGAQAAGPDAGAVGDVVGERGRARSAPDPGRAAARDQAVSAGPSSSERPRRGGPSGAPAAARRGQRGGQHRRGELGSVAADARARSAGRRASMAGSTPAVGQPGRGAAPRAWPAPTPAKRQPRRAPGGGRAAPATVSAGHGCSTSGADWPGCRRASGAADVPYRNRRRQQPGPAARLVVPDHRPRARSGPASPPSCSRQTRSTSSPTRSAGSNTAGAATRQSARPAGQQRGGRHVGRPGCPARPGAGLAAQVQAASPRRCTGRPSSPAGDRQRCGARRRRPAGRRGAPASRRSSRRRDAVAVEERHQLGGRRRPGRCCARRRGRRWRRAAAAWRRAGPRRPRDRGRVGRAVVHDQHRVAAAERGQAAVEQRRAVADRDQHGHVGPGRPARAAAGGPGRRRSAGGPACPRRCGAPGRRAARPGARGRPRSAAAPGPATRRTTCRRRAACRRVEPIRAGRQRPNRGRARRRRSQRQPPVDRHDRAGHRRCCPGRPGRRARRPPRPGRAAGRSAAARRTPRRAGSPYSRALSARIGVAVEPGLTAFAVTPVSAELRRPARGSARPPPPWPRSRRPAWAARGWPRPRRRPGTGPDRGAGRRSSAGMAARARVSTPPRSTSSTACSCSAGSSHSGTPPAITPAAAIAASSPPQRRSGLGHGGRDRGRVAHVGDERLQLARRAARCAAAGQPSSRRVASG